MSRAWLEEGPAGRKERGGTAGQMNERLVAREERAGREGSGHER